MTKKVLAVLLTLVLILGQSMAALADERVSELDAAEKAAAMQAEAQAEIAARGEEYIPNEDIEDIGEMEPDEKAAAMQAEVHGTQPDWSDPSDLEQQNPDVEARRQELEKRFGILIRYEVDSDGKACIGTGALAALDMALTNLTPSFVREVSNYCKSQTGKKLTYSFIYSPYQRMNLGVDILGHFNPESSIIEIYLPSYGENVVMGGENPLTYLHEFGHAAHTMLMDMHGEGALKREWTTLNGSDHIYRFGVYPRDYDNTAWISAYASTSYSEDFCEVFAHTFLRVRDGQGFASRLTNSDGATTVLGKKVRYLEKLLKKHLSASEAVIANYRRVYTTPEVLGYKGYAFSGDYLQFSGCAYPRYVLDSLLNYMEVEQESSTWIRELGGWEVTTAEGALLMVFPGGMWFTLEGAAA